MKRLPKRPLVLVAGILLMFAASIALLLKIIPSPHRQTDYLIIGTLATLITLVILFAVLVGISPGTFYRRR